MQKPIAIQKPVAESCLRNQEPIYDAIRPYLERASLVLEIGSGTGQHAAYFAPRQPDLIWQPTDLAESLQGIDAWREEAAAANLLPPVELDVTWNEWPLRGDFDLAYTANTIHFVSWDTVMAMFAGLSRHVQPGGVCLAYGAFNRNQQYVSEGNRHLDQWLRSRDPLSGIKDTADVASCAVRYGFRLIEELDMPANNVILVLKRDQAVGVQ